VETEVINGYQEFNSSDLELQLALFCQRYKVSKVDDAVNVLRAMSADMRHMFSEIEKLVHLLLVIPCSSIDAERGFSALRHLKTWLWSTVIQNPLNGIAVRHCHQEVLDTADIDRVMKDFLSCSETRVKVFDTSILISEG